MKNTLIKGTLTALLLVINTGAVAGLKAENQEYFRAYPELTQMAATPTEAYRQCTQNCDAIKNHCMNQCQNNAPCQQQCAQQAVLCHIRCRY